MPGHGFDARAHQFPSTPYITYRRLEETTLGAIKRTAPRRLVGWTSGLNLRVEAYFP